MERNLICGEFIAVNDSRMNQYFAISNKKNPLTKLEIKEGVIFDLLIDDIPSSYTLNILINKNAKLRISLLLKNVINSLEINAKVEENAEFLGYCADFSIEKNDTKINIDLVNENASAIWHLASLSSEQDKKNILVNLNHIAPLTYGRVDNYGVCRNLSTLIFAGTSSISKGSHNSKTSQNAKIMVFDEDSNAAARPILKIDENDIEANHSAGVGKINDEHMFYLTSRGLTTSEARQLITYGYLKPILVGFDDENYQKEITELIERRL